MRASGTLIQRQRPCRSLHFRSVVAVCAVLLASKAVAACGGDGMGSGGLSPRDGYIQQDAVSSRILPSLGQLVESDATGQSENFAIVRGRFSNARPGRGFISTPAEQSESGTDTERIVSYDDESAGHRSVYVDLTVASSNMSPNGDHDVAPVGTAVQLEFFVPGRVEPEALMAELEKFDDVIVPVVLLAEDHGEPAQPAGGGDIIVRVEDDGRLTMPFATEDLSQSVLGGIETVDQLDAYLKTRSRQ